MKSLVARTIHRRSWLPTWSVVTASTLRVFHVSARYNVIKPFILADIGEGIREVQIIQWFVKPGARVEQFDKLCEVQSDKASVEITSRFDGVIKKLHYDADDMALVGKPLLDIEMQDDVVQDAESLATPPAHQLGEPEAPQQPQKAVQSAQTHNFDTGFGSSGDGKASELHIPSNGKHAALATPAVRHLTRELKVNITDVQGTGKDGRVLKEDVQKFAVTRAASGKQSLKRTIDATEDKTVALTPVQAMMFKTMTRSLTIPHFLYSDSFDMTAITKLRHDINQQSSKNDKISALAFILKGVSLAMTEFPVLNIRLDTISADKPQITLRNTHNFGIAVDTSQGLIVPVIKAVNTLSVAQIASEIVRLSSLAKEAKLSAADLTGGSFTVSNIGSIGGTVVSPVIVEGQVAILGVGKARIVPAFGADGALVKREECVLSWSADHRVVDGATVARAAESVRLMLEQPARMLVRLR